MQPEADASSHALICHVTQCNSFFQICILENKSKDVLVCIGVETCLAPQSSCSKSVMYSCSHYFSILLSVLCCAVSVLVVCSFIISEKMKRRKVTVLCPPLILKNMKSSAAHLHPLLSHQTRAECGAHTPCSPQPLVSALWACISHTSSHLPCPRACHCPSQQDFFFRCSESEVDLMQLLLCQDPATACFTVDAVAM